jgi:hypothetical protein
MEIAPMVIITITLVGAGMGPNYYANIDAVDDYYESNGAIAVQAPGVLGNDAGSEAIVTDYTQPANGAVRINSDGTFTYTPYANFCGMDSFTYTISVQSYSGSEVIDASTNIIDKKVALAYSDASSSELIDPDSRALIDQLNIPLSIMQSSYNNYPSSYNMTIPVEEYQLQNEIEASRLNQYNAPAITYDTASVNINVRCPIDAIDDFYRTEKNLPITVPASGVLENDIGSGITVSGWTQPTNGAVSMNSDGSFSYTPNANYFGMDRFTYTISSSIEANLNSNVIGVAHIGWISRDPTTENSLTGRHAEYGSSVESLAGSGTESDTATVTIDVRDTIIPQPEIDAVDDVFSTNQNTPLTIPSPGVLVNDRGEALSVIEYTNPSNGAIRRNQGDSITYSPKAGFTGVDSFAYTIRGTGDGSDSARVTVDVIPLETDDGRGGGKDPDSGHSWKGYGKKCDEGQFTIGFMFEALKGGFQVNTNMVGNKRYATGFLNNGNGSLSVYIFKEYEDGSQKALIERLVDYSPSAIENSEKPYLINNFKYY